MNSPQEGDPDDRRQRHHSYRTARQERQWFTGSRQRQERPAQQPQTHAQQNPPETGAETRQSVVQPQGTATQPVERAPAQQAATQQSPGQQTPAQQTPTRMNAPPVRDVLSTDVPTAHRDTPIDTVVSELRSTESRSAVVVENHRPISVLTDRDIALAIAEVSDIADQRAGDIIEGDVVTGDVDMTVLQALELLEGEAVGQLPIVDDDGQFEGLVDLRDIVQLLGTSLGRASELLESQSV